MHSFSWLKFKKKSNVQHYPEIPNELSDLPDELWLQIFSSVNAEDLLNLSLVCKRFTSIAEDNNLWSAVVKQAYPAVDLDESESSPSIKEQIHRKSVKNTTNKMTHFVKKEHAKQPEQPFEKVNTPLAEKTNRVAGQVVLGGYWALPILTYELGKFLAKDPEPGDVFIKLIGYIALPLAVFGDIVKAPIAGFYAAGNVIRLAALAPANLLFGGRDKAAEENNLYRTMYYSLLAVIDCLNRLKLEDEESLAAMSEEKRLQPLMAMVCFLIAYNSLTMDKDCLLIDEKVLTQKCCPRKFLPFFNCIMQLKESMQANLTQVSDRERAKQAIEWVPTIWKALKSDEGYSVDNEIVQGLIDQLKELAAMLMRKRVGQIASERIARRLG